MAATRHRLSHEDIWQVMNTSDEVSDTELARSIGSTPSAIHNLRWKLRNQPWTCRISWDPCPQCGEPLIRQHGRQLYHSACRPQVLQRLNASYEPERQARLTREQIEAREERRDEYLEHHQALTAPRAHASGQRWSEEDYDYLYEQAKIRRVPDIALDLGRTYQATQTKLNMLKKRMNEDDF